MTLKNALISQSGNRWEDPAIITIPEQKYWKIIMGYDIPMDAHQGQGELMVGKAQSSLGGRGERLHPLANRGGKPFINTEAEQRDSFCGVDLALKPRRPLSSRPVRRRLNTVHSRPPTPPQEAARCFAGKDPTSYPLQREPGRGVGKKREEFGWTCENVPRQHPSSYHRA